jgi:hypothetical protein
MLDLVYSYTGHAVLATRSPARVRSRVDIYEGQRGLSGVSKPSLPLPQDRDTEDPNEWLLYGRYPTCPRYK